MMRVVLFFVYHFRYLPLPVHERKASSWTRFLRHQGRVRREIPENAREEGAVPILLPLYRYANPGRREQVEERAGGSRCPRGSEGGDQACRRRGTNEDNIQCIL